MQNLPGSEEGPLQLAGPRFSHCMKPAGNIGKLPPAAPPVEGIEGAKGLAAAQLQNINSD